MTLVANGQKGATTTHTLKYIPVESAQAPSLRLLGACRLPCCRLAPDADLTAGFVGAP